LSNGELLAKAESALVTGDITYGFLSPEQAKRFIRQMFDVARTTQICRTVAMSGDRRNIDKIGIGSRIARIVDENEDVSDYTKKPSFGRVELDTVKVALPWELSEETLEDTIENRNFEETIAAMMTTQFGLDLEDLYWNGDTSLVGDPEESGYVEGNELLYGLDGWLKQLDSGSHIVDLEGAALDKGDLFSALKALAANGYAHDSRFAPLLDLALSRQDGEGRWLCGSVSRTWPIEQRSRPSKWVTLDALRVLKTAG